MAAIAVVAAAITTLLANGASPAWADTTTSPGSITMGAYWSGNAGFGSAPPSVYVTSDGGDPVVHLQGAAKQLSSPTGCDQVWCLVPPGYNNPNLLGVLPPGARPDRYVYTIVHTMDGTYADLDIDPQGDITMIGAKQPDITDYSFVSLEGITFGLSSTTGWAGTFYPSAAWSDSNIWGAASPAFFETDSPAWADGIVHLLGALQQISTTPGSNYVGALPQPYWPPYDVHTVVHTLGGTYADLTIDTSGNVSLDGPEAPNFGFVSLEGVTYPRLGLPDPSQPFALNTINWSSAGGSNAPPGWYADPTGVVHLEGEARQVTGYGNGDLFLVGTLPQAAWPDRTVYTIAATNNGTYSDLFINAQGQIWLLVARSPAATNLGVVSLDGISYHP